MGTREPRVCAIAAASPLYNTTPSEEAAGRQAHGLRSTQTAFRLGSGLVKRGAITRWRCARAVDVLLHSQLPSHRASLIASL